MGTYNSYVNKRATVGQEIPVWLGNVQRIPVGGTLASAYAKAGMFIPDGTPMKLSSGTATPFVGWEVVSVDSTTHTITIKSNRMNILPKADDILQLVGTTFATTGAAGKVSSISANAATAGQYDVVMTDGKLDGATEGEALTYSAASAVAASGASIAVIPTHYLYGDLEIDPEVLNETVENVAASVALVNFHGEGFLIKRTPAALVATQLAAAIPNVMQDNH